MHVLRTPTPAAMEDLLRRATAAAPTYAELGAADAATLPSGYHANEQATVVGMGRAAWERVGDGLLRWEVHRGAGMAVVATDTPAAAGSTVVSAAPYGPAWVPVPCRVVAVLDEHDRRGFLYGTLLGNPVSGEERFTVELGPDDRVRFRIRSFSRPAGLPALFPPAARGGQWLANRRYLAAARRLAGPG